MEPRGMKAVIYYKIRSTKEQEPVSQSRFSEEKNGDFVSNDVEKELGRCMQL